ncbi:MAG: cysteine--tRNA ligase, partial [Desulfuromonadales bacterium]|nr:cysteine--tRNA ligase [Desulfuromonadales bacterium]NIS43274.1 cysteine--tRNA ligase [Desulfuromonadales bacterium]
RFYEALQAADEILDAHPVPPKAPCPTIKDEEREVYDRIEVLEEKFAEAMDDDFNTALAIGHLFEAVRGLNRLMGEKRFDECPLSLAVLKDGARKLRNLGAVLGFFGSDPQAWLEKQKSAGLEGG